MWFSYPKEENWVPVPIKQVREIQQINKSGELVPDLGESKTAETATTVKAFDYENVVGQDSLTRLDDRSNANNKRKKNNNNRKPKPTLADPAAQKPIIQVVKTVVQVKTVQQNVPIVPVEGAVLEGANLNRRRNRNRPNRNPNNPNNPNNTNQQNNNKAE